MAYYNKNTPEFCMVVNVDATSRRPVSVTKPLVVFSLNSAEEFFANSCPAKVMLAKTTQ
jgi:hypothetical protein